ncbi:hypothetical protein ACFYTS_22430 [Nocardia sp. NPDC004151]|uniref:hypothetical protein n=1 Tax=Nocardia sp. NPDC004151 TaxID=3364304 RepID=UPI0036865DEE
MSVNIAIHFLIADLADGAQAEAVEEAIDELLEQESIDGDVAVYRHELAEGGWAVFGLSYSLIIMSRFWSWEPEFEESFVDCVGAIAPDAEVDLHMFDVDEEREQQEGAEAIRGQLISWLPDGEKAYFRAALRSTTGS